jgi:hypothetical protein
MNWLPIPPAIANFYMFNRTLFLTIGSFYPSKLIPRGKTSAIHSIQRILLLLLKLNDRVLDQKSTLHCLPSSSWFFIATQRHRSLLDLLHTDPNIQKLWSLIYFLQVQRAIRLNNTVYVISNSQDYWVRRGICVYLQGFLLIYILIEVFSWLRWC